MYLDLVHAPYIWYGYIWYGLNIDLASLGVPPPTIAVQPLPVIHT